MDKFIIHVITDLHLRDIDGDKHHPEAIGEQGLFYSVPNNFRSYTEVANRQSPDMIVALGDCIHGAGPPDKFMKIWNSIEQRKALIPGNHDLDAFSLQELANHFGHGESPVIAGSPFQQSIVLKKEDLSCRILMLDTSFTAENQSDNHWQHCSLHDDALGWVGQELEKNQEDYILLCSHVSPHHYSFKNFYDVEQAKRLQAIIGNYVKRNPEVRVINFAGHAHPEEPEQINLLGKAFPAIIFPSMIRQKGKVPAGGPNGVYSVVTLEKDDFHVNMEWIRYQ